MSARAASASDDERPKKRLRKGTHSCWACKRRKVKCIFKDDNDTVCAECAIRHIPCVSQEHGEDEASPANRGRAVRDRVGRLEDLMEVLLKKIDSLDKKTTDKDSQSSTILVSTSETALPDILTPVAATNSSPAAAPIMALFDRPRLSCRTGEMTPCEEGEKQPWASRIDVTPVGANQTKLDTVRKILIEQLPSTQDLQVIFSETPKWWTSWRVFISGQEVFEGREWPLTYLAKIKSGTPHPAEVACALLVVAISLQALPSAFDFRRLSLPTSPDRLLNKYMNVVSSFVTTDDEMVGSIPGLEAIILQGKFLINMGRPRSSWMMFRRGLNLCLLMGLNRRSRRARDQSYFRAREVWWEIFQSDRFLSLILGLPNGVSESACDMTDEPELMAQRSVAEQYRMRLSSITGKMVDRNVGSDADSYAVTQDLDVALDSLAAELSSEWWSLKRLPGERQPSFTDRISIQFVHLMNKAMLHVPFMMQSFEQKRYTYSHDTCLDSCRGMLQRYLVFRRDCPEATSLCRIGDFIAFTACIVVLMRAMCIRKTAPSTAKEAKQNEDDWHMINETIKEMTISSKEFGGTVAEQSVKILTTLRLVGTNPAAVSEKDLVLSIPYFGTVRISKDMGQPIAMGIQAPIHPYFPPSVDQQHGSNVYSANPFPSPAASDMTPPAVQEHRSSFGTNTPPTASNKPSHGDTTNPTMTFVPDTWVFPAFDSTIHESTANLDPATWSSIDFNMDLGGVNAFNWSPNPNPNWDPSYSMMDSLYDQQTKSRRPSRTSQEPKPTSVASAIEAYAKAQAEAQAQAKAQPAQSAGVAITGGISR